MLFMTAIFLFFLFFLGTCISSSIEEIVSREDLLFKAIEEENVQEVETLLKSGANVKKKTKREVPRCIWQHTKEMLT